MDHKHSPAGTIAVEVVDIDEDNGGFVRISGKSIKNGIYEVEDRKGIVMLKLASVIWYKKKTILI